MGYLDLLRSQPRFRRLWLGQVVSQCGDWLQLIALFKLFPTAGAGAEWLAGLFIIRMLPSVVWAPVVGVVADRFRRGRIMVACDLGRALVVLGYLFVRDPRDVGWVFALAFVQESISAFFEPARTAAVPQIVPPEALFAANALAAITWSVMLAAGSVLGGIIVVLVGVRAAFVANAVSFVASAWLIGSVGVPPLPVEARAGHGGRDRFGLAAIREGLSYLRSNTAQAFVVMAKGLWGVASGIVVLVPIYSAEVFSQGRDPSRATGIMYAGRGLGALLGPLVAKRLFGVSVPALRRAIQVAFPLAAVGIVAFAYAPDLASAALLLVAVHAGGSIVWVNSTQLLQLSVPNRLQGRVFAVELAGLTVAVAASSALVGALVARGAAMIRPATFAMAGAAAAAAILWTIAMQGVLRRLTGPTTPEPVGDA